MSRPRALVLLGVLSVLLVILGMTIDWSPGIAVDKAGRPGAQDGSRVSHLSSGGDLGTDRSPTASGHTVMIQNRRGAAIPGARIIGAKPDLVVSTAGSDGVCQVVDLPPSFVVCAEGYLDQQVSVLGRKSITVVMRDALKVTGVVRRPNGVGAAGAWVLGWPAGGKPSMEDVWEGLAGGAEALLCECDSEGRFELDVPRLGVYQLCAGGAGMMTYRPEHYVADPAGPEVRMVVRPAYATFLRYQGSDGPLSVSSDLHHLSAPTIGFPQQFSSLGQGGPALVLAGADPSWMVRHSSLDRMVLAGVGDDSEPPSVGPIVVSGSVPGYAPIDRTLQLPSLAGGLVEEVITCEELTPGFGSVRVMVGVDNARRLDSRQLLQGGCQLRLAEVSGGRPERVHWYYLTEFDEDGAVTAESVPAGQYRLSMRSWDNRYFMLRPGADAGIELVVDVEVGNELLIDLSFLEVGSLSFDVVDSQASPVEGRVAINLGRLRTGGATRDSFTYIFLSPPYQIPIIRNGRYAAFVREPEFQEVLVQGEAQFELRTESDARIELSLK